MKNKTVKMIIRAIFCLLLLTVVILALLGLQHLLKNSQEKKNQTMTTATEQKAVTEEPVSTEENVIEQVQPETEMETETETEAVTLQNPVIPNVEALDNTSQGWGMGPTRDELNRPVDALSYQEKYAGYSVDFIKPTEEKVIYLTFDEGYEYGMIQTKVPN